jgi:large subunit ribosomal protein L9
LKVILKEYQDNLGDVGDVVEVKAGYANNYLIPQGIALLATDGNINQMKLVKKAAQKVEAKNIDEANKVGEGLEGLRLEFIVKTGEEGKLYGSITNKDLAEKVMELKNMEIDRKKIDLPEHIKELGEYDVDIKLYKDIKAGIKVIVEPDEESKALIEAHQKEKEAAQELEKEKIDAEIEAEAEKGEAQKDTKEAKTDASETKTDAKDAKPEAKEDKGGKEEKDEGKDK